MEARQRHEAVERADARVRAPKETVHARDLAREREQVGAQPGRARLGRGRVVGADGVGGRDAEERVAGAQAGPGEVLHDDEVVRGQVHTRQARRAAAPGAVLPEMAVGERLPDEQRHQALGYAALQVGPQHLADERARRRASALALAVGERRAVDDGGRAHGGQVLELDGSAALRPPQRQQSSATSSTACSSCASPAAAAAEQRHEQLGQHGVQQLQRAEQGADRIAHPDFVR